MVAGGAVPTAEPCVCARIGIPVTTTPAMTAFCAAAPIRLGTVVAVNEMSTRYSPAVGTRYAVAMAILHAVFAALAVLPRAADCASTTPAGERRARSPGNRAAGGPAAVVPVTKVLPPTGPPACSGIAEVCTTPVAAMAMFAVACHLGTDSCRVVFVGDPCRR